MYNLVQVYFVKSPTGAPYRLAYNQGDTGAVRPQMAEILVRDGVAEYVEPVKAPVNVQTSVAPPVAPVVEKKKADAPDLSTVEGVVAHFGDDVTKMKKWLRDKGITYSKRMKKAEYFHAKIAKANA